VAKQGNTGEKWPLNYESCFSWLQGSFTCRKPMTWTQGRATDFITLKIHRPLPGLNPRTLGPVASTLTTTPPRATYKSSICCKSVNICFILLYPLRLIHRPIEQDTASHFCILYFPCFALLEDLKVVLEPLLEHNDIRLDVSHREIKVRYLAMQSAN
jgi:hypothetical protein